MRKNVPFVWGEEQHQAMEELKMALTIAPTLVKITYDEDSGEIILATDASGGSWGAVLMQLNERGYDTHPDMKAAFGQRPKHHTILRNESVKLL
jgi:hypothetical protein